MDLREKEQYLHFWQQIKVFYFLCVSQHLAVLKLIFTLLGRSGGYSALLENQTHT